MKHAVSAYASVAPVIAAALLFGTCAGCSPSSPPQEEGLTKGEVVGGYVVHPQKSFEMQVKQERVIAEKQERELGKQQEEIDDIKRQEYWNNQLKGYVNRTDAGSLSSAAPAMEVSSAPAVS